MKTAAILVLALALSACNSFSPVPIRAGDVCDSCGKVIDDVKIAGEAISTQGSVLKFRTTECLARYVRLHPADIAAKYVTDYRTGRFIRPEQATYVQAVINENTREKAYLAFASVQDAVEYSKKQFSSPVDWLMILNYSAGKQTN